MEIFRRFTQYPPSLCQPTKVLQASTYVTIHGTIPSINSLFGTLRVNHTEKLRPSYSNISKGVIATYDKFFKYYAIYHKECGSLKILYIATISDANHKHRYFETSQILPHENSRC
ncbi:hypothetical protein JCM33374_g3512 [Metschnikowia sp. JCM 33374]|nr:hypothetical protein JCM33374_g3512 [Metschnikowia sp. JCM 33374]